MKIILNVEYASYLNTYIFALPYCKVERSDFVVNMIPATLHIT